MNDADAAGPPQSPPAPADAGSWSAFGFEWQRCPTFGLEGEPDAAGADFSTSTLRDAYREHLLAHTLATFPRKTLLSAGELRGARVLDAGCGNGRYSVAAAMAGAASVVAADPSEAADVAWANLAEFRQCRVEQASIDELELSLGIEPGAGAIAFDVVFSIGVLQHLADPAAAVRQLARLLAPGGVLSVHVYRRRNPVSRAAMALVRPVTSRLGHRMLWRLCAIPTLIGKWSLVSRYVHAAANLVLPCYPTRSQNFDWYAPGRAGQFTPEQVRRWFADAGLTDLADDDPYARPDSYYNRLYPKWMKHRDGCLKRWVGWFFGPMGLTVRGRKTGCG